jgi:hypothetical protein
MHVPSGEPVTDQDVGAGVDHAGVATQIGDRRSGTDGPLMACRIVLQSPLR